jgi:N utilization substance protein B
MISRRGGREFTMQLLYASEVGDETLEKVADKLASSASPNEDPPSPEARQYGLQLARAVRMRAGEIDRLIRSVSEHWDVDRLAVVDRIILRMAIAELLSEPDVPSKVCINEAVEIAKKFSTENSSRFVNGILDAVVKQLQELQTNPSVPSIDSTASTTSIISEISETSETSEPSETSPTSDPA